jgi:hypothetical protein
MLAILNGTERVSFTGSVINKLRILAFLSMALSDMFKSNAA